MGTRVKFTIENNTGKTLQCTDICCESFEGLNKDDKIPNGETKEYTSNTNDRIFCTWVVEESSPSIEYQMGMTSPKSSHNSAYGSVKAGLQKYERTGTPVAFTYKPGNDNKADWNHGDHDTGDTVNYGSC